MLRRAIIPASCVLLVAAVSCRPAAEETEQPVTSRWVPAGDDQLLDLSALDALAPQPRLEVSGDALEHWRFSDLDAQPQATGLQLIRTGDKPRAIATLELDAATVQALEIEVDGLAAGRASLYWAAADESFARQRVVHNSIESTADGGAVRFELATSEAWRGTVGRLRFDLPVGDAPVSLRGLSVVAAEDLLAPLTEHSWAVAFGRQLRSATLVTPASPLRRDLLADRNATSLSFAYGLLPGSGCDAVLRVTGAAPEPLFERLVPAKAAGAWRLAEMPIPSPTQLELQVTVEPADDCTSSRLAIAVGNPSIRGPNTDPRPNVVLISIDTLRPDHLGMYDYGRDTSPRLDAWAQNAVIFDDAWANAAWTLPSHASMFTGQTALQHGVNSRYPAPPSLLTLAERLGDAGFHTAAWTGGSWLSPKYGLYQGFDEYRWWNKADAGANELVTHVEEISQWLAVERDRPIFLFVHTYEVHSPYRARAPHYARFTDAPALEPVTDRLLQPFREGGYLIRKQLEYPGGRKVEAAAFPQVIAAYDSGIAYADEQFGELLAAIEEQLGDNVVVLITSDHGEALGEEGRVSHGRLEDEDLRIPWLLRLPQNRGAAERVTARVSSVDLVPTVLDAVGLASDEALDGVSALTLLGDSAQRGSARAAVEAYAASSNLGISLRLRDGGAYLFNDTPWAPKADRERAEGLRSADPELLDRLRGEVERRLTGATGLHLLAWNGESTPLDLALVGPCVHPLTVKITRASDPELIWERPQHARWQVPSGSDMRIRFDTPVAPCVTVEVRAGDAVAFRLEIDPQASATAWHAGLVDGTWKQIPAGSASETGLSAWLTGPVDGSYTDPTGDDAELMEQLRALGYLQ